MGTRSISYARVTYEELVADPGATIDRIARGVVGSSATEGPAQPRNHTVGGNPMRFDTRDLQVREDVEWRTGLGARDRQTVNALTFPLRWRYGYGAL
jgi:hypothetical protein